MNSNRTNRSNENKGSKTSSRSLVRVQGKDVRVGSTNSWRGLVATFVASRDVRESSRGLYTRTLSQFFLWVEAEGKSLVTLTRQDVLSYKDHLLEVGLSSLTVGSYITAVRSFYEWAESEKLYPNIAKGVKPPRRPKTEQNFRKQHLTDGKSRELLEHFEGVSLRDYAIVNLILRTGLRTIEVVRADIGDITFMGGRRVLKVWGKGRDEKTDFVVLSEKAWTPIQNYLTTARKGARAGEPLFTSTSRQNYGERLTTRTISGICKDGLKAIGLDGKEFTAHSLRHTTAVAILAHGGSLYDVQRVLRHSDPATTEIYLKSREVDQRLEDAPELTLDKAF